MLSLTKEEVTLLHSNFVYHHPRFGPSVGFIDNVSVMRNEIIVRDIRTDELFLFPVPESITSIKSLAHEKCNEKIILATV